MTDLSLAIRAAGRRATRGGRPRRRCRPRCLFAAAARSRAPSWRAFRHRAASGGAPLPGGINMAGATPWGCDYRMTRGAIDCAADTAKVKRMLPQPPGGGGGSLRARTFRSTGFLDLKSAHTTLKTLLEIRSTRVTISMKKCDYPRTSNHTTVTTQNGRIINYDTPLLTSTSPTSITPRQQTTKQPSIGSRSTAPDDTRRRTTGEETRHGPARAKGGGGEPPAAGRSGAGPGAEQ